MCGDYNIIEVHRKYYRERINIIQKLGPELSLIVSEL